MKALLSIQLVEKPEGVLFRTSHEEQIRQQYPEIIYFGLDNFSEVNMITYAKELIHQSDCVLILIESQSDKASPNKLLKLLNALIRERFNKGKLVLLGEHPIMLEKMAKSLGENHYSRPTDQELVKIAGELFS